MALILRVQDKSWTPSIPIEPEQSAIQIKCKGRVASLPPGRLLSWTSKINLADSYQLKRSMPYRAAALYHKGFSCFGKSAPLHSRNN
ncbi:hypothetical protein THIOM_002384 [Candidatus Thiomargarita nelsonii]|uniref:Uncharacterized protein n=1 Tax=Candidatus Thiomargarita nelsonii TaxID=1003181 RepID=A0A176S198_9GAMM|nr:hypothetical protein THIOM_002384 [Candidatus Thiomargarita nelsonii]